MCIMADDTSEFFFKEKKIKRKKAKVEAWRTLLMEKLISHGVERLDGGS